MNWIPTALFSINFSLMLLHEMDAIREKEWKMFVLLNSMREETAYIVFSAIHLPLYAFVIFTISQTGSTIYTFVWLAADIFLIAHAVIHYLFRKHAANGFHSVYSRALIYGMSVLSAVHLLLIL